MQCYVANLLGNIFLSNSIFFVSNSNLCSALQPNYLGTHSSDLCQIRALEKAFKNQNNVQSVPKILVLNAIDWTEQTLKIFMQYSTYFACKNDLCRAVLTNLLGDIFLSFYYIRALKKAFEKDNKCQR